MTPANVTERQIRDYILTFHETLAETAQQFLPESLRGQLWHTSLLPAKITCYVSTQFGLAFEYTSAEQTTVETVRGSARVEDLFVGAPRRFRDSRPLFEIGTRIGFSEMTLRGSFPFRFTSKSASLEIGNVSFEIGPWRREVEYAEIFGDRSSSIWSEADAVARAKDEVLAAATELRRADRHQASLREFIDRYKQRSVLVLGTYDDDGRRRLRTISRELERLEYDPMLVEEVPDHPHHDLHQKVTALGSVARFVVIDDSVASGHISEIEICKQNHWVTVILRGGAKGSSWMTAGASVYSNVIREASYDPPPLQTAINDVAAWAEDRLRNVEEQLSQTYPWRLQSPTA